jgi:hypothetical protein
MNISVRDDLEFQVNIIMNDLMPKKAIKSDLSLSEPASDLIKNIIKPLTAQKATKISSWKREFTASTSERERSTTSYGLRNKLIKKTFF